MATRRPTVVDSRASDNIGDGPQPPNLAASMSVNPIPAGEIDRVPEVALLGQGRGNRWICLALTDGNGNPLKDPVLLGRCVQNF